VAGPTGAKQGGTLVYDPNGAGAGPDNSSGNFDYAWLGQYQRPSEHETATQTTVEMGARPYDVILGRFLSIDPIEGGTSNPYAYVADPVNQSDLTGLAKERPKQYTDAEEIANSKKQRGDPSYSKKDLAKYKAKEKFNQKIQGERNRQKRNPGSGHYRINIPAIDIQPALSIAAGGAIAILGIGALFVGTAGSW